MKLYDYYRSSASYRVRIALHLKNIDFETIPVDLLAGDHKNKDYKAHNPQGLVPLLVEGDNELGQSLAIMEYLDETYPEPLLVSGTALDKAYIRQMALLVACEIHPMNNPKVWKAYVGGKLGADEKQMQDWYHFWILDGLAAYEALLIKYQKAGAFTCGDTPSMADLYLIPQLYNARRFNVDLQAFSKIRAIELNAIKLDAFQKAAPEAQATAPADMPAIHGAKSPLLQPS